MNMSKENLAAAFSSQRRQQYIDDFVAEKILNLGAIDNYRLRQQAEQSYQTYLQTQIKKEMKTYKIASAQDIVFFFQSMYTDHNLLLDLDLPFLDYTTEKDEPCFTKEEADYLDSVMAECFNWCELNKIDVYDLGCDVQKVEFKKRGFYPPDFEFETA